MNFIIDNEDKLNELAPQFIKLFGNQKIVLFYGEMGAGKTTLIKKLCTNLGVKESTSSPTFSIVNEYLSADNTKIFHFDFYRIDNELEVMDLGYEDYFYSDNFCFIEWPEKIPNLLPDKYVKVKITVNDNNKREISIAS